MPAFVVCCRPAGCCSSPSRIATLGEEVRDPARTIPRAIPIALGITLVVYAVVAAAVLGELGSATLASADAPLAEAVRAAGRPGFEVVVRAGAAVAALGSLLALILGVSRTTLAMARDRHLPYALAAVHPRFGSPYRAEVVVGVVVAAVAAVVDVRGAIGFSSFAVLLYYAIANASAWTLGRRLIPATGLVGCLLLAVLLPLSSVLTGAAVVLIGTLTYGVRKIRQ
jgi:basic amino acid/polyamine antiporter, APA family